MLQLPKAARDLSGPHDFTIRRGDANLQPASIHTLNGPWEGIDEDNSCFLSAFGHLLGVQRGLGSCGKLVGILSTYLGTFPTPGCRVTTQNNIVVVVVAAAAAVAVVVAVAAVVVGGVGVGVGVGVVVVAAAVVVVVVVVVVAVVVAPLWYVHCSVWCLWRRRPRIQPPVRPIRPSLRGGRFARSRKGAPNT